MRAWTVVARAILGFGMPEGWARGDYGKVVEEPLGFQSIFRVLGPGKDGNLRINWYQKGEKGIEPLRGRLPYDEVEPMGVVHVTVEEAAEVGIGRRK